MKTTDKTERLSDDQIVTQYAESLLGEYERLEVADVADQPAAPLQIDSSTQIVAPWDGCSPLLNSDFFRVKYAEMNAARFTFWIGQPPTTPYFAVILNTANDTVVLKARVVESTRDMSQDSALYLVTTEFSGTIDAKNTASLT